MKSGLFVLSLITFATACCASTVTSLTCLQCNEVSHPRYCQVVAECKSGEVCFTESITTADHNPAYRLGCAYRNTAACSKSTEYACAECCSTNLCNADSCGERGYPLARGPVCYSCSSRLEGETCNKIEFCHQDEVCYIAERTVFGEKLFDRGCAHDHLCGIDPNEGSPGTIFGKRALLEDSATDNCHTCCKTDLCNHNCAMGRSTETTSTTTTTTTTTSTTTTTTTTIPPLPSTTTVNRATLRDCYDILNANLSNGDGLYTIYLTDDKGVPTSVPVFCNMTDGGWTVFQYRYDESVNFNRSFSEYVSGFGRWPGEFWLGLKWLHLITSQKPYVLKIDYKAKDNTTTGELRYTTFEIGPPMGYKLNISGFSGNNYDAMAYHNGYDFKTYDRDTTQDFRDGCSKFFGGGWWYYDCYNADFNGKGKYFTVYTLDDQNFGEELRSSSMSIKPL